jgi:hypothetical protein
MTSPTEDDRVEHQEDDQVALEDEGRSLLGGLVAGEPEVEAVACAPSRSALKRDPRREGVRCGDSIQVLRLASLSNDRMITQSS